VPATRAGPLPAEATVRLVRDPTRTA